MEKDRLRLGILKQVESGEIPLETASRLLEEIDKTGSQEGQAQEDTLQGDVVRIAMNEEGNTASTRKPAWGILFWIVPLILGVIITAVSGNWLVQSYQTKGMGFGFWLSFIPIAIGIFLIYLAWVLERSRWLYINISQQEGEKPQRIVLGFPLPIRLAALSMRLLRNRIQGHISQFDVEELLESLENHENWQEPISIIVDDNDGSKVEISIF